MLREALARAIASLAPKDRLRLSCYYAQGLTLAQTGGLLKEHEATVSRQLARTRRSLREQVEQQLRTTHRLTEAQIGECFESAAEDAGPLDLRQLLADESSDGAGGRKKPSPDRSIS
jgi:hypothetical protein